MKMEKSKVIKTTEYKGHIIETTNNGSSLIYDLKSELLVGCSVADAFPVKQDNSEEKAKLKIDSGNLNL